MQSHPPQSFVALATGVLTFGLAFGLALGPTAPASAQSAGSGIENLKQMKLSGDPAKMELVDQGGKNADLLRANLKKVKLPAGFKIDLYAVVPDARSIAVAPSTNMMFVGTRKTKVWAVTNRNGGDTATEVKEFAPPVHFKNPNAVCWTKDGILVVVESNRVLAFPAAEFFYENADVAVAEVVPQGKLIPAGEESFNHSGRICRIGPDNLLYITLGQPFNVPPRNKLALYTKVGIGGIVRMKQDGTGREVYATGVRNSVGMDFNPKDQTLWFTDNQTDGMGDDIPKGEINRATKAGQFFGYPFTNSGTRITENGYDKDPIPAGAVEPEVMTDAHAADLGMIFYSAKQFPAKYQGGFFSAQHGSWNRTKPIGARVLFTSLKADGTADKTEVFAEGWLDDATGTYRGRPVDVAVGKDGSLYISDDYAGAIYRVTYSGS
jgi:glucose/arabinose dehydrogenase